MFRPRFSWLSLSRRHFLLGGLASLGLTSAFGWFSWKQKAKTIPGNIIGASSRIGHELRGGIFPAPSEIIEKDIVIIGGGISGLAAGHRLITEGHTDLVLLDLEDHVGGNSSFGTNAVCSYPWGAHYVSLLTKEAKAVRRLFESLGVITGYDREERPLYHQDYICNEPDERLFIYGRWQEGLVPSIGVSEDDRREYQRFFSFVEGLKHQRGKDNKPLFSIPVDESSHDPQWLALDQVTMKTWMASELYTSPYLHWVVDYCCRDDYGTSYAETSAWAGLHYFASRQGVAANTDSSNVITWPEGNGWLVKKLGEPLKDRLFTSSLVVRVESHHDHVVIDYKDIVRQKMIRINARSVIMATPRFISKRLLVGLEDKLKLDELSYAPWMVANITLNALPEGAGVRLAWDNVIYNSPYLGYVVATHQISQMHPIKTVITYYWPLTHLSPKEARQEALERSIHEWQALILAELFRIHPELEDKVEQLDVMVWGHAMIRPTPGFIWGRTRKEMLLQHPPVFFAHSDMSGISIFEEAYTHGVRAAEGVMQYLGIPFRSIL